MNDFEQEQMDALKEMLERREAEVEGHKVCEANMDAEVERLRAENEVLVKQFDAAVQSYQKEVERLTERVTWLEGEREQYLSDKRLLEAEAERLRAVLERIADGRLYGNEPEGVARDALAKEDK